MKIRKGRDIKIQEMFCFFPCHLFFSFLFFFFFLISFLIFFFPYFFLSLFFSFLIFVLCARRDRRSAGCACAHYRNEADFADARSRVRIFYFLLVRFFIGKSPSGRRCRAGTCGAGGDNKKRRRRKKNESLPPSPASSRLLSPRWSGTRSWRSSGR